MENRYEGGAVDAVFDDKAQLSPHRDLTIYLLCA